jgi:methionyl-tRNA formyltransferase
MRTALLANNRLGADVGRYLAGRGDLVGLVVHPAARRTCGAELAALEVPTWEWPDGFDGVRDLEPDCLLSVLFAYRVPPAWLELPSWRAVNLHPGLLPWNAGCHPNVWPLVDGSPAGTTLHVMEATFDTGAILAQEEVPTYPDDTAKSLYQRLEAASLLLFRRVWPGIEAITPRAQEGDGTYHRLGELSSLDLDASELGVLDRLRARTFPPYGSEFERNGQRFRVRVEIERLD